jgi:hypothetical protein
MTVSEIQSRIHEQMDDGATTGRRAAALAWLAEQLAWEARLAELRARAGDDG